MTNPPNRRLLRALGMAKMYWPDALFYDKQRETIQSCVENDETVVVAGNKLGKDYTAAYVALSFFVCPQMYFPDQYVREVESWRKPGQPDHLVHTRRVVTTSVKEKHLDVLWGEMGKFLATATIPLMETRGGPLVINSLDIRFKEERDVKKPFNYMIGCVSEHGEGLAGHHAAYTLCIVDEASGVDDDVKNFAQGWAKKFLIFGNPRPCQNFFRRAVAEGNVA